MGKSSQKSIYNSIVFGKDYNTVIIVREKRREILNWVKLLFNVIVLLLFTIVLVKFIRLHKLVKTEMDKETTSKVKRAIDIMIMLIAVGTILSIITVFL